MARAESTNSSSTLSLPVLLGGLLTTVLALAAVWWLAHNSDDFNVMNWYAWFILPVGPLLVGLVAGSGYGLASWFTGFRVGTSTLAVVVGLQLVAYGLAQYIDYLAIAEAYPAYPPTFFQFFDEMTRSIFFESSAQSIGSTGQLGALGYGIRLLEVIGFIGGALIILGEVRGADYCEDCGVYMKTREVVSIPASADGKAGFLAGRDKKAAHEKASELAYESGVAIHDAMFAQVLHADVEGFTSTVEHVKTSTDVARGERAKVYQRAIVMTLACCPKCRAGTLSTSLRTMDGDVIHNEPVSSLPVPAEFVRAAQL